MINTRDPLFENKWVLLNNKYHKMFMYWKVIWYLVNSLFLLFEGLFIFFNDFFLEFLLQNVFIVPYTTWKNYLEPWFEDGWQVTCPFLKKRLLFSLLAISKGPIYWINGVHALTPDILPVNLIPILAWVSILPDRPCKVSNHSNNVLLLPLY